MNDPFTCEPPARLGSPVDVAVCFGNSSVRLLVQGVGGGSSSTLINLAHPSPGSWAAEWLPPAQGGPPSKKPTPLSLRSHLCSLLDAQRFTVRTLVVVVSGRVLHAEGLVEESFMLGRNFAGCALMDDFRTALPRARPSGLALINDTACSAVQAYLELAQEVTTAAAPPQLFPALVVDAGTGCSFAFLTLCSSSRVRVVLLEPWVGSDIEVHSAFPPPPGARGTPMPLWQAVSDSELRALGARAWNVRMQCALAAVLRRLAAPAAEGGGGVQAQLRTVFFTGGNCTRVSRTAAEAAAPGLLVRGLPLAGQPELTRDEVRKRYLHAALAVASIGHLLDVHNIGQALEPGGVLLS
jgi:hypothetical protein